MSTTIDPKTLKLFLSVLERGTIAAAAEQSHIAPAAISKRLSDLESRLGVHLVHRSNKGVTATPAGLALRAQAERILSDLDSVVLQMRDYASGVAGQVQIAANISTIVQFLPNDLRTFLDQNPLVQVGLQEHISSAVADAVHDGEADIGLLAKGVATLDLEYFNYRKDELVILAPPEHPLASFTSVHFKDTLEYDYVGLHTGSHPNMLLQRAAAEHERAWRCKVQVTSFDAQCRMVQAGMGIGAVPRKIADFFGPSLNLVMCKLEDSWAQRQLVVAIKSYNELSPAARLLVDHFLRVQSEPN